MRLIVTLLLLTAAVWACSSTGSDPHMQCLPGYHKESKTECAGPAGPCCTTYYCVKD